MTTPFQGPFVVPLRRYERQRKM